MSLAYTLRSYGARVVSLVKSYIHTAPPEQRQMSQDVITLSNSLQLARSHLFHKLSIFSALERQIYCFPSNRAQNERVR